MVLRGQTTTEYTILLAVVILTFVSATTLLTWDFGGERSSLQKSEAYWKSARPFSLSGASVRDNGDLILLVRNNGDSAQLNTVIVDGTAHQVSSFLGKDTSVTISIPASLKSKSGVCSVSLKLAFNAAGIINSMQKPEQPLVLRCPQSCREVGESCLLGNDCCSGSCNLGSCRSY